MTRLDHGLCEPHLRCSGVARPISEPSLRVRPDGEADRQGPPLDQRRGESGADHTPPGTDDRPASAAGPGNSSRRSVAEWLKSAPTRARPRWSDLGAIPGRSVAGWVKSAKSASTRPSLGRGARVGSSRFRR
jgi:hypothetical protein